MKTMRKAYVIAQLTIQDPSAFAVYSDRVERTVLDFEGRFLVRSGSALVLDGEPLGPFNVVVEFPSLARAQAWYESDAYKAILPDRLNHSMGPVVLVEAYS